MAAHQLKKIILLIIFLFLPLTSQAKAFNVSLFVPRNDTVFWESLVKLTQSAAEDLKLNLTVYSADNHADKMLTQVKTACSHGTDGIIFMNYENLGEKILSVSEMYEVPALLYNTGFSDPMMVPRKQYPFWIGSMTPDDVRAGGLLAERLIEIRKKSSADKIHLLAIEGNPIEKSSIDRVQGMKDVISNRSDVKLYDIAKAGKAWSRTKAKDVFKAQFSKHPDINTVWAAGDDIALGVLDAMADMGLDRNKISTGGIDWSSEAIKSIRSGNNKLSVGGHMLEGAWAIILMYDYLNGKDFSRENTVFKTRMHVIDGDNVDQVSNFLSDKWESIDFRSFSKFHNDTLLYRFDLLHLIDKYYPKVNSFTLTDKERLWLKEHPKVRLGIDINWPPFETIDPNGNYEGMVADYVKIIQDRLGIECVYSRDMNWSETLKAMKEGRLDMIAAIAILPERKKSMTLTKPYLTFPLVVITNDNVDFVEDMQSLANKKVALVRDYSEQKILFKNYPNINYSMADTTAKALELVVTGKAYAYVGNLAVANHTIKKERFTNLKVSGTIPHKLEISMGVRKDWPILAKLVTKSINSISEQERDIIYQRWITLRYEHGWDYTVLLKFGAAAFVVLSVSIYWNRRLSILNGQLKKEIDVRVQVEEALLKEQEMVKKLAVIDPLTGLFNRRKFQEVFPLEIRKHRRSDQFLVFAIMDIDYFKQYNDNYGHQKGDEALILVGKLLLDRCKRATDYCFRLGGEEFGILFSALNPDQAIAFVEGLRNAIEELYIEHKENQVSDFLTVSFGLIVTDNPSNIDAMYKSADKALYRAKQAGRNRTEIGG